MGYIMEAKYTCDRCNTAEAAELTSHGLPKGWVELKREHNIPGTYPLPNLHLCIKCHEGLRDFLARTPPWDLRTK